MIADADIAGPAALMGDRTRAQLLLALAQGHSLPASELAARARIGAPTASAHLAKLVEGGLLAVERQGRHRYYRLADPAVAQAIEALAAIAPMRQAATLRESVVGAALREGRTCYDHLAGRLGIALADALLACGVLERDGRAFVLGDPAPLARLGIDVDALKRERRELVRACLDWSERRHHVAGALGAALARTCFDHRWIERTGSDRAVRPTAAGRRALRTELGLQL